MKLMRPGITRQILSERQDRNDLVASLAVGKWVMFTFVNDSKDTQVWLCRVMSNLDWGGQGVCQNTTRGLHVYQDKTVKVDRNKTALNIRWYETIGLGLDECACQIERSEPRPIVTSNTFLTCIEYRVDQTQYQRYAY